jgi:UDPglucose 6-dehydrogenase
MNFDNIGFIGLGKLGLPCAAAMSVKSSKKVFGFDVNPNIQNYVNDGQVPYQEEFANDYLKEANLEICSSIDEVIKNSDVVFVAVQTPHEREFEGITPTPEITKDFDYSFLEDVFDQISATLKKLQEKEIHLVVISTVLPGTMRTRIIPKIQEFGDRVKFSYNPYFIAMGTTISDFLNPEFILIGTDDKDAGNDLSKFYRSFLNAPSKIMMIESAELTKVAYNTFIGFKIVFANTIAEIVDKRGGNSDEVTDALSHATARLMSAKYLKAGMADGGGCHPRDQIAMSHLAKTAQLSADPFAWLARARDSQTENQAKLIKIESEKYKLPVVIMGEAYKKNVNLTIGSPAKLLSEYLKKLQISHEIYDPWVRPNQDFNFGQSVFFLATNHDCFREVNYPDGSVCIDPWGDLIQSSQKIIVVRPGRESSKTNK